MTKLYPGLCRPLNTAEKPENFINFEDTTQGLLFSEVVRRRISAPISAHLSFLVKVEMVFRAEGRK